MQKLQYRNTLMYFFKENISTGNRNQSQCVDFVDVEKI